MDKRINGTPRGTIPGRVRRDEAHGTASLREGQIQRMLECTPDMIARIGGDGRLHYISPSSMKLLGMNSDGLGNLSLYELIHSADCERVRHALDVTMETGDITTCELRMNHVNGNTLWMETRFQRVDCDRYEVVSVFRDISGRRRDELEAEERRHLLEQEVEARSWQLEMTVELLKKQVEEHKRDKESLELSEMRYTTLVENTLTGIYIHDGHKLTFCNERFAQIFGIDRDNMENISTDELFSGGRSVGALLSDKKQEELVEGKNCDGRRIWLKVSRARMVYRGQSLVVGNVIDITEQIAINERLKESERELHALSAQLMAAQEQERKRISNELHDGLGQRLSAIKFAVENVWRNTDSDVYPEQSHRLSAVVESIRDSIEEVRRVSMDLRPSILDDLGLIATIGWFCREFTQLFPAISIHRNISAGEVDIPDEVKVVIFRIIQEAFHNITKHAQADRIELDLLSHNNSLCLMIRDNGCGISNIDCSPCAKGLGLRSMRERAKQSHGEFRIDSTAGQGTTISVQWPRVVN